MRSTHADVPEPQAAQVAATHVVDLVELERARWVVQGRPVTTLARSFPRRDHRHGGVDGSSAAPGYRFSSNPAASGASIERPQTARFVGEQQSRPALLRIV